MRNLAGVVDADKFIKVELETAQTPIVNVSRDGYSEVPYTVKGKLKDVYYSI